MSFDTSSSSASGQNFLEELKGRVIQRKLDADSNAIEREAQALPQ